jgi:hypothetical protein
MSETLKAETDPVDRDPIVALKDARARIEFLERQMEAVLRHLDSGLPEGVSRAWPSRPTTEGMKR